MKQSLKYIAQGKKYINSSNDIKQSPWVWIDEFSQLANHIGLWCNKTNHLMQDLKYQFLSIDIVCVQYCPCLVYDGPMRTSPYWHTKPIVKILIIYVCVQYCPCTSPGTRSNWYIPLVLGCIDQFFILWINAHSTKFV